jgi:hypothetical protein
MMTEMIIFDAIEREHFIKELEYAKAEAARFKEEHQGACHLVAQMHAAAVGEVTGPNRGVIEDVEDLRLSRDQWKQEWELSERNKMDREAEIVKLNTVLRDGIAAISEDHEPCQDGVVGGCEVCRWLVGALLSLAG